MADDTAVGAIRAGLRAGTGSLHPRHGARVRPNQQHNQHTYLRAALPLVTEHREHGIKALAVAEHARGHNIGGSLLKHCKQLYFHCGYVILYGQTPPTPGRDAFYTCHDFEVLPPGHGLDLWVVFGVHSYICLYQGERTFVRKRRD